MQNFIIKPNINTPSLTRAVEGINEKGEKISTEVIVEKPVTVFLNNQEIITNMTIGDYPNYLAVGYLLNQNMLSDDNEITAIDHDDDLDVVVVRTQNSTDFEKKIQRKIRTSGCAQGTVFGDLMDKTDKLYLPIDGAYNLSTLYKLLHDINIEPSLYLQAGAIHGCVLCENDTPLIYMEDVGRHNAVDKIAGYMYLHHISGADKILYTTGRLTSEMVIKTIQMGIPMLISRSGFTAWGVELAIKANLTLIGRARGKRLTVLSAPQRLIYDE